MLRFNLVVVVLVVFIILLSLIARYLYFNCFLFGLTFIGDFLFVLLIDVENSFGAFETGFYLLFCRNYFLFRDLLVFFSCWDVQSHKFLFLVFIIIGSLHLCLHKLRFLCAGLHNGLRNLRWLCI